MKSEELIGELNINNVQRGVLQSCSIGYWISKDKIGLGFMSESINLIKNFIFNELNLHRIEAACLESNVSSLNVLKNNDFHFEGIARKYLKINGKWQDHLIYSCLETED
jgi:ribosomal-protein-alanine N-acetyltransferase